MCMRGQWHRMHFPVFLHRKPFCIWFHFSKCSKILFCMRCSWPHRHSAKFELLREFEFIFENNHGPRSELLMRKTNGRKSRYTVPLNKINFIIFLMRLGSPACCLYVSVDRYKVLDKSPEFTNTHSVQEKSKHIFPSPFKENFRNNYRCLHVNYINNLLLSIDDSGSSTLS
jgi:hypothetical protein